MMVGLGIIIYISSIYSLKTRAKLSANFIDNSKTIDETYKQIEIILKKLGGFFIC